MSRQPVRLGYTAGFCLSILLALLSVELVQNQERGESPGNPKTGRDLFLKKGCIRCHSVWESQGKRGPNLASVGMGRNLYELCASIWSHWSQMNAVLSQEKERWSPIQASEIRDIVAYLYYLNYYAEPGDSAIGAEIFTKRGCSTCHASDPIRASGKIGPALYEMRTFQGAITLAVAVWKHGNEMLKEMSRQGLPWPQLKDKDVANLVALVRSQNGITQSAEMKLPGDPTRGRALYRSKSCVNCHKTETGESGAGPNLASSGSASSLSSLVSNLWNHYPRMASTIAASKVSPRPISTEEMEDLLAYIYWMKAYGLAGKPLTGRNLYQSKNCVSCHSPSTAMPGTAPNLVGSPTTRSPYSLLAAIWNHGPKMDALLRERNLVWPDLTGEEMRDLIAYLQKGDQLGMK